MNTQTLQTVIEKEAKTRKNELVLELRTLEEILSVLGKKHQSASQQEKKPRRVRGSSFRLDSSLLNIKGNFTMDSAAETLVKEKLIENSDERGELHNCIARLVKNGKVAVVKEGKGRAKATYKINKFTPKSE